MGKAHNWLEFQGATSWEHDQTTEVQRIIVNKTFFDLCSIYETISQFSDAYQENLQADKKKREELSRQKSLDLWEIKQVQKETDYEIMKRRLDKAVQKRDLLDHYKSVTENKKELRQIAVWVPFRAVNILLL